MKTLKLITLALLALGIFTGESAKGQTPPPPDCVIFISLGGAGNTAVFDNRVTGCVTWTMNYAATGFSGLTLTFQSATGAITAGVFGTYTGSVVTGANPATSTTGTVTVFSNGTVSTPWLRVLLSGLTGSGNVTGVVYGYKTGYPGGGTASVGGCVGTITTPCVVDGPVASGSAVDANKPPVQIGGGDGANVRLLSVDSSGRPQPAGTSTAMADGVSNTQNLPNAAGGVSGTRNFPELFNGATWDRQYGCSNTIIIDDSTSGNTQIIALSGSTQIRICKATFTTASAVDIKFTRGTGSNCGSGTADLSMLYQAVLAVAEDYMADRAPLVGAAGNAVCLNLSATVRTTGQVWYAQY